MDVTTAVRERIFDLCRQRGITINRLGTVCGITPSTLKNIAQGRNGVTVVTLKKICDGLEINLIEFFDTEVFRTLEQELR